MARETKTDKAHRYLIEGRLHVSHVSSIQDEWCERFPIVAEIHGTTGVYALGYDSSDDEWRCTCKANQEYRRECAHLIALRLVVRAPTRKPRIRTKHWSVAA